MSGSAVQGGRRLQLRILGFPVHIDLSFPLIMGLLGYNLINSIRDLVLWLLVATLSVLVHELGHAVVARTTGARPEIALTGFGGVTTYLPPGPVSRFRSLSISLAGPLVGLLIGLGLLVAFEAIGGDVIWDGWPRLYFPTRPDGAPDIESWLAVALAYGMWTCIGWSVLNLIPVVPLDGGQAMRELLPGDPQQRTRRAAGASIVFAALFAGLAYWRGEQFVALFLLFFGLTNLVTLRTPAGGVNEGPRLEPEQAVVGLLWQGAPSQARATLAELPPGTPVDLAVHGAVMATTGQPEQGFALLHQEVARRPGDVNVVALLVLARALLHDWDTLDVELRGPLGTVVPQPVLERAAQEATATGREDVARRLLAGRPPLA